jgi:predicted anti-sigma-YlaC factor YlaD
MRATRELSGPPDALLGMDCVQAREAMSAQMDGEAAGVSESLLDAHVERCEGCQAWREAAFEVTRRSRMTGWTPPADLTTTILAGVGRRRFAGLGRRLRAVLLVAAAVGQLILTIPLLLDGSGAGMTTDTHGMHELGVFDFALAVAFLVGAVRPRLANGLAWPCCAAAFGLLATAVADIVTHRTFETHELRHLIAVAGALLLCLAARDEKRTGPDDMKTAAASLQLRQGDISDDPPAAPGRAAGSGAA